MEDWSADNEVDSDGVGREGDGGEIKLGDGGGEVEGGKFSRFDNVNLSI